MKRAQEILYRFLHPPKWVLLILPPIVFAVLTYVLLFGKSGIPAYLTYGMSAYCMDSVEHIISVMRICIADH